MKFLLEILEKELDIIGKQEQDFMEKCEEYKDGIRAQEYGMREIQKKREEIVNAMKKLGLE